MVEASAERAAVGKRWAFLAKVKRTPVGPLASCLIGVVGTDVQGAAGLLVRNKGPKPDSFRDRSEVVAEGKMIDENGAPVLVATSLMAKCPSKYQGASKDKLFDR